MKTIQDFKSDIKKYDCMNEIEINKNDYETCIDNYNFEYGKNTHLKNWEDFITWCIDNWKF